MEKCFSHAVAVQTLSPVKPKFILDQFVSKVNFKEELEICFGLLAHKETPPTLLAIWTQQLC